LDHLVEFIVRTCSPVVMPYFSLHGALLRIMHMSQAPTGVAKWVSTGFPGIAGKNGSVGRSRRILE